MIKTRIDLVSLSYSNEIYKKNLFHFNVIKQLQSFVSVNTSFYGPYINQYSPQPKGLGEYRFLRSIKTRIDLNKRLQLYKMKQKQNWLNTFGFCLTSFDNTRDIGLPCIHRKLFYI